MTVQGFSANAEQAWNELEWLASARELIHWSNTTSAEEPLMLVVRHSHRETIASYDDMIGRGLTPLGHAMAKEFGRRLPPRKNVHIFHSYVPRCQETAEDIAEGIRDRSGQVDLVEASDLLVGPRVVDPQLWRKLGKDGIWVLKFVNDWSRGAFTERQIEPIEEFKRRVVREVIGKLRSAPANSMHLHVTHDLFLVAARSLLQTASASHNRPAYLGGFGVVLKLDRLVVFDAGRSEEIPTPEQE